MPRSPIPRLDEAPLQRDFGPAFGLQLRFALWTTLPMLLPSGVMLCAFSTSISWWQRGLALYCGLAAYVLMAAIGAACTCAGSGFGVDPTGIIQRNGFWRRRLNWDDIARVRPRRSFSLRLLELQGRRGAARWFPMRLPLILRDMDGFREAIHRHAPSDHPLRQALDLPPSLDAASTCAST